MQVIHGECAEVMSIFPNNHFDSIVTDPPYGIGQWDWIDGAEGKASPQSQQAWHTNWAREALRVSKPGAHALVFGGSRTQFRIACGLEDAGWDVRDTLLWLYGTGRPKAADIGGDWEGWRSQLKPAYEPIIVARKPIAGTIKSNLRDHGTGAFNIEKSRTGESFPTNVVADEEAAHNLEIAGMRWFNCPKPTRAERDAGLEEALGQGAAIGADGDGKNRHPTVKPITLLRWLCGLATRPAGHVLDPFLGSGSTACAAVLEGFDCTGIEMDEEHVRLAEARIKHWGGVAVAEMLL